MNDTRTASRSRLNTFVDAAFAVAISMLVISVGKVPANFTELVEALKASPAFLVGFVMLAVFWCGHRRWSRHFDTQDSWGTTLSLGVVFVMLVYVYPLRLLASSSFSFFTGGWISSEYLVKDVAEITDLMAIYGIGFSLLSGLTALLFQHSVKRAKELNLTPEMETTAHGEFLAWTTLTATGIVSVLFAWLAPLPAATFALFAYAPLPILVPFVSKRYARKSTAAKPKLDPS